ncbi:hypothetical protein BDR03DRAFT_955665, partial [Suillus americanus]
KFSMVSHSSCTTSKPPLPLATTSRPIPSSKSTLSSPTTSPVSISYTTLSVSNSGPNCNSHGGMNNRLGQQSCTFPPNTNNPRPDDPRHICVHPPKSCVTFGRTGESRRSRYGKLDGYFSPSSLSSEMSIDREIPPDLPLEAIVREGVSCDGAYTGASAPDQPRETQVVKATGELMCSCNMNTLVCATTVRPLAGTSGTGNTLMHTSHITSIWSEKCTKSRKAPNRSGMRGRRAVPSVLACQSRTSRPPPSCCDVASRKRRCREIPATVPGIS